MVDTTQIIEYAKGLPAQYSNKIIGTVVIIVAAIVIIKLTKKAMQKVTEKVDYDKTIESFVGKTIVTLMWIIAFIILLSNFGINVSGLVAGLGIMGFIAGFALKDTLGNLASGVFIIVNKPFKLGSFVEIGAIKGTIRSIGIAACTIHTYEKKKITIPNSVIWGQPIINYTGENVRRLDVRIGVSYKTNLTKAFKVLMKTMKRDKRILQEEKKRPFIGVKDFADSAIILTVRPYVKTDDYWPVFYTLMRNIKEDFDKAKIVIPFPQRDVHLKKR